MAGLLNSWCPDRAGYLKTTGISPPALFQPLHPNGTVTIQSDAVRHFLIFLNPGKVVFCMAQ